MKKLMKILVPILLALALLVTTSPMEFSDSPNCGFSVAGDEEDVIELITLLRV